MAVLLSICTQKGGAGKTTLTLHLATHFNAIEQRDVVVIDADYPQHSLFNQRERDLRRLRQDPTLAQRVEGYGRLPFEVLKSDVARVPPLLDRLAARKHLLVFVDLPGSLNVAGYEGVIRRLDGVLLPMEADALTFASGLMTLDAFSRIGHKGGRMVPTYLLWNRYRLSERSSRYADLEKAVEHWSGSAGLTVPFFRTRIRDLVAWKDNRSALIPYREVEPLAGEVREAFFNQEI